MSENGGGTPESAEAGHLLVLTHSRPAEALSDLLTPPVPVSDLLTPPVMESLQESVAAGAGFPDALRRARADAAESGDPVALATACSFVALGV